jgi:tRNA-specific 2-thiouridylase
MAGKNVFIGLSGGVDSTVAALLLKQQGYNVTAIHIRNTETDNSAFVKRLCEQLDVPLQVWDMRAEFKKTIIDSFTKAYQEGQTPNPCVLCNEKIKFGSFFDRCLADGADYISTGHYARIVDSQYLAKGLDKKKDQSYYLYRIKEDQLPKILFPLGEMNKQQVVQVALDKRLEAARSKESQDLCFISDNDIQRYLRENIEEQEGDIVDIQTRKVVGTHRGIYFYTLGQRSGLHVGGSSEPYYVSGKNPEKNILYVAKGQDHKSLWAKDVTIKDIHWTNDTPDSTKEYQGMIRYRMDPVPCTVSGDKVKFSKPVWSPSPGQSLVLYDGEKVVGGGVIS